MEPRESHRATLLILVRVFRADPYLEVPEYEVANVSFTYNTDGNDIVLKCEKEKLSEKYSIYADSSTDKEFSSFRCELGPCPSPYPTTFKWRRWLLCPLIDLTPIVSGSPLR